MLLDCYKVGGLSMIIDRSLSCWCVSYPSSITRVLLYSTSAAYESIGYISTNWIR